ncbi:hypothetical protein ABB30_10735 [Stenotrophomonas ginsengisoli]|uniref:DUF4124 domain-containing protein n=2 Tax=Stenotrophomonas ginsengisoli TaxID=336566 RepID=A0A0R0DCK5_9GAMM|nr:hypothetical protein ABB30_10735 [Stenotrophomonas ginsengisoli]
MRPFLLCCLTLPLLSGGSGEARAQSIQRCSNADGVSVFTDKPCELLQARPRIQPGASVQSAGNTGIDAQRQCPQRLSQLVDQIQQAISSGDSNRLAAVYWWGNLGNQAASRQLERLEAMVQRPLVDIAPVYPASRALAVTVAPAEVAVAPTSLPAGTSAPSTAEPVLISSPPPTLRPRPYALRIVQTLGNGSTPASNVLQLRRQYGCFWVNF